MSDAGFVDFCLELLAPLGRPRARRMFGGHGLYVDDLFLALIVGDTLYLKTAEQDRPLFEQAGCRPFTYEAQGADVHVTSYYSAPDSALESPADMLPWARRAQAAAVAARARKPASRTSRRNAASSAPKPAPAATRAAGRRRKAVS